MEWDGHLDYGYVRMKSRAEGSSCCFVQLASRYVAFEGLYCGQAVLKESRWGIARLSSQEIIDLSA